MNVPDVEATRLRFADCLIGASAYVPEWRGLDRSQLIRLDRNENTNALPSLVEDALIAGIRNYAVQSYPEHEPLLRELTEYVGVAADWLLPTNGSDQGIDLCLRTFLNKGGRMLVARPEFSVFTHVAAAVGAEIVPVPYNEDLSFPYQSFSKAATDRPDLIVLINPNNPTGTEIRLDYIEEMAASYPDIPVLVDEAYYEFTGQTAVPLLQKYSNLLVLRTFSKAFALAGLRLGYIVARPEVLREIRKLQGPYDVNHLAVIAGRAQLSRIGEMLTDVRFTMEHIKAYVVDYLRQSGVEFWPGSANFVLVRPPDCTEAVEFLRASGILVRPMSAPTLRGTFRISMGTMEEMEEFITSFGAYMQGWQQS